MTRQRILAAIALLAAAMQTATTGDVEAIVHITGLGPTDTVYDESAASLAPSALERDPGLQRTLPNPQSWRSAAVK